MDGSVWKYFASVASAGRAAAVQRDTTIMSSAETIVMGTTGMKPNTVRPNGARPTTSRPPNETIGVTVAVAGGGTVVCRTATASTASAVQTVDARAPHLVLPFQNS